MIALSICVLFIGAVVALRPDGSSPFARRKTLSEVLLAEHGDNPLPEPSIFSQTLDHFSAGMRRSRHRCCCARAPHLPRCNADDRTWSQRYWLNTTFASDGGPLFIMLGGEGPLNGLFTQRGHMADMARRCNCGATIASIEHRFYGESQPFPSLDVENLKVRHGERGRSVPKLTPSAHHST